MSNALTLTGCAWVVPDKKYWAFLWVEEDGVVSQQGIGYYETEEAAWTAHLSARTYTIGTTTTDS